LGFFMAAILNVKMDFTFFIYIYIDVYFVIFY
jgi:hypothetical protein